ncbi:unnamed protein product [Lactuca saligna]|uniref:Peptidase M3A/M3B catalytic domain-containing protein n=1 Tax=Lactuca saligna TaxID=75948 RepID=A0AA35UKM1_LACSI|nr:unnamed protein product [Lactuca saligna]
MGISFDQTELKEVNVNIQQTGQPQKKQKRRGRPPKTQGESTSLHLTDDVALFKKLERRGRPPKVQAGELTNAKKSKLVVGKKNNNQLKGKNVKKGPKSFQNRIPVALHHPDEGDLGYIYLDLNCRQGKYPGCAHFAIRGGRTVSKTEYQLPVIVVVCNFSKPHNSSIVRLNHSDVDTLFHEFEHALHSLLSRTALVVLVHDMVQPGAYK